MPPPTIRSCLFCLDQLQHEDRRRHFCSHACEILWAYVQETRRKIADMQLSLQIAREKTGLHAALVARKYGRQPTE
jgi:hypothetical protein